MSKTLKQACDDIDAKRAKAAQHAIRNLRNIRNLRAGKRDLWSK